MRVVLQTKKSQCSHIMQVIQGPLHCEILFSFTWLPGDAHVSLAFEEAACLLTFLIGLSLVVHFSCQSKSEINLLQAEQVTSAVVLTVRGALAGTSNHSLQLAESNR